MYTQRFLPALLPLAFLSLALSSCGSDNAKEKTAVAPPADRIAVKIAPVEQKVMSLPVHASGMLSSASEQRLSFKIGGVIRKIYVDEGDNVRPGQLLAVLDKTEIDAQVGQARQGLAKAERDLARVESLFRDSSATKELLDNATTGRDVARESERIAVFNQQYAEIRATRAGKIVKKGMNEGEIAGPGMPVFALYETGADDWQVTIFVSDRDWARLSTGLPAQVSLDAYPDMPFKGRITDLAPAADPSNGLYAVDIRVAPQGRRFAPGLFAEVDIQPAQTRAYQLIPIEAIVEGEARQAFVFTVEPDGQSVRKRPVRIAFIDGPKVAIAAGLEGVQDVITSGAPYLTEKKKVAILGN